MIDLVDRHDQHVAGGHRVDRHERHAVLVAPHERARELALDDLREHRAHARHPTLWPVTHDRPSIDAPGAAATDTEPLSMFDGIWSIPNAFTLVRLLLLPVFLWVLFGLEDRAAAAWMLGALGATDWVDGYLARRLGQVSEFGKVFDPTVDRLLFLVATTAIIIDGSIPLWFALAVLAREVLVGLMMAIATVVYKMPRIDVTYWGKLATFLLMFAVPGFLMGNSDMPGAGWIRGRRLDPRHPGSDSQLLDRDRLYSAGAAGGRLRRRFPFDPTQR